MRTAAIYLRVSTVGQVDGFGLAAQEDACRRAAQARGFRVVGVFTDEGVSGRVPTKERPGWAEALVAVEAEAADALFAARMDRVGRTLTVQEDALAALWATGCEVHMADDERGAVPADDPDDPLRTLLRQITGAVAEYDRSALTKRMRDGRKAKAAAGGHATGPAPYGWTAEGGELHPVAAEQTALARMLTLRDEGATTRTVATVLAAEGHPTKRNGAWTQPVVARILARHRTDDATRYATGDAPWLASDRTAVPA